MKLTCLACKATREEGKYLCLACWRQLSIPAQRSLSRTDKLAFTRLRELRQQIEYNIPLPEIHIVA